MLLPQTLGQAFVVAPMIGGRGYCSSGATQPDMTAAVAYCQAHQQFGAKELGVELDKLEPGGPQGQVQVGYTLGINLLQLLEDQTPDPMLAYTNLVTQIKRPVVLYLFANHFSTTWIKRPVSDDSMARFRDLSIASHQYFGGNISPLTLNTSPMLDINRRRADALKKVGKWFHGLPDLSKRRVIAITMAGELHHFFDDFANGMGRFDNIRTTDYAPLSVKQFQDWLASRYKTVLNMNTSYGSQFKSFEEVHPPSKNLITTKIDNIFQHYDSYAHGELLVDGWLDHLPDGYTIKVFLDGLAIGSADYGLSRQDVYEAVSSVKTANVGFRYTIDFSQLPRGVHTLQVIADGPVRYEIAKRQISIMGKSQDALPNLAKEIPVSKAPKEIKFYLDRPSEKQAFFFNPLARDWYRFRSEQVTLAYETWMDECIKVGLPKDKLYSHQIAVATVGSWNPLLTASDASLRGARIYKKGINLYAGSANIKLLKTHYLLPHEQFGVPEFHPMAWKNPAESIRVIRELWSGGARFVSPYFLSTAPDKFHSNHDAHNKFRVSPSNPEYGSDHFYRAIQSIAKN